MAENPACQTFIPMLSPFIDGELLPSEREAVERHLAACQKCAMRTADFRAESGLIRIGMEMLADQADFKGFTQEVMARLTPEKPPLGERIRLSLSELFIHQRRMMVTSLATAAVVMLLALPFILRKGAPLGYANQRLEVQMVAIDEPAKVAPVVMETESGDTIIWTVEHERTEDEAREEELDLVPQGGEL